MVSVLGRIFGISQGRSIPTGKDNKFYVEIPTDHRRASVLSCRIGYLESYIESQTEVTFWDSADVKEARAELRRLETLWVD